MNNTRQKILQNLTEKNQRPQKSPSVPGYQPRYSWNLEQRIKHFSKNLQAVHSEVYRTRPDSLSETLNIIIQQKNIKHLLSSARVDKILSGPISHVEQFYFEQAIENWKAELFNNIDASITTSKGGIAETGSIILWPDHDEPRLMSLVPPIHIVIVRADKIYETFISAITEQNWQQQMPTNAILISGPSKTADIEQILAYGIHGPKQLIVLIIET